MDSSTKGTLLELRAMTWLLSHGFRVWRAVDGGQTGDLVVDSSVGLLEVEVRVGKRRKNRPGVYFRQLPQDTADLYLVVLPDESGVYWRMPATLGKRTLIQAYPILPRCEVSA